MFNTYHLCLKSKYIQVNKYYCVCARVCKRMFLLAGEPYSQALAKGLILVFFFIAASVLGTPWRQIRQAWSNSSLQCVCVCVCVRSLIKFMEGEKKTDSVLSRNVVMRLFLRNVILLFLNNFINVTVLYKFFLCKLSFLVYLKSHCKIIYICYKYLLYCVVHVLLWNKFLLIFFFCAPPFLN